MDTSLSDLQVKTWGHISRFCKTASALTDEGINNTRLQDALRVFKLLDEEIFKMDTSFRLTHALVDERRPNSTLWLAAAKPIATCDETIRSHYKNDGTNCRESVHRLCEALHAPLYCILLAFEGAKNPLAGKMREILDGRPGQSADAEGSTNSANSTEQEHSIEKPVDATDEEEWESTSSVDKEEWEWESTCSSASTLRFAQKMPTEDLQPVGGDINRFSKRITTHNYSFDAKFTNTGSGTQFVAKSMTFGRD
ncbi:hypothetical protein K4F52_010372 [Lecanicillium sp. MT-2017a]|nr:hypothetical protein K4F52_010372 [Lecanicillium sp. MT-2017a]